MQGGELRPGGEARGDYRLVIVLVGLTQLVMTTDFSILSVALPSIKATFNLKAADLSLLISAGAVPLVGFMILAGRAAACQIGRTAPAERGLKPHAHAQSGEQHDGDTSGDSQRPRRQGDRAVLHPYAGQGSLHGSKPFPRAAA